MVRSMPAALRVFFVPFIGAGGFYASSWSWFLAISSVFASVVLLSSSRFLPFFVTRLYLGAGRLDNHFISHLVDSVFDCHYFYFILRCIYLPP